MKKPPSRDGGFFISAIWRSLFHSEREGGWCLEGHPLAAAGVADGQAGRMQVEMGGCRQCIRMGIEVVTQNRVPQRQQVPGLMVLLVLST